MCDSLVLETDICEELKDQCSLDLVNKNKL